MEKKVFSFTIIAIDGGDKVVLQNTRVNNDESSALDEYFALERMRDELRSRFENVEFELLFDVFCEDREMNSLARYEFFSKVLEIKNKARLPFSNIIMIKL